MTLFRPDTQVMISEYHSGAYKKFKKMNQDSLQAQYQEAAQLRRRSPAPQSPIRPQQQL
jgi:hypothetical protein